MSEHKDLARMITLFRGGNMTRRQLVRELTFLGLSASAIGILLSACSGGSSGGTSGTGGTSSGSSGVSVTGATADERALNAARQLAANAKKKTLTILHPAGSVGNMKPFVQQWKDATGIDLAFVEVPLDKIHQKGMEEAVAQSGAYDLMLPSPISLPDFAEAGLIYDLSPWVEKYNPEIDNGDNPVAYPLSAHGNLYKGKVYGLCTDGDQWVLFMRDDMLNDPAEQAAFKQRYGRDLKKPVTWEEYDQLLEFFTRKDQGLYGGLEYRSRYYVKWQWMQRFVSRGKLYWDDNMKFLGNSPEGIQTVKELMALNPYLPPESLTWGWSENYSGFGQGVGFSSFSWPSFFRYNNDPSISPLVAGKIATGVVPGSVVNGKVVHAAMLPFAWSWVISKYSENAELAYLYAQWMYSPKMSTLAVPKPEGYFDPFRIGHFDDPGILEAYSRDFLEFAKQNVSNLIPDFCLKGGFEYQDALDKNLHEAITGLKTPEAAMAQAAREMDEITERMGRDSQIEAWKWLRSTFPKDVLDAAGVKTA